MTFVEVACYALGVDLARLAAVLNAAKIPNRIFERDGQQVVVVIDEFSVSAEAILAAFDAGELADITPLKSNGFDIGRVPLSDLFKTPVTIGLILTSIIGFALVAMQWWDVIFLLLFQPTYFSGSGMIFGSVFDGLSHGQIWRLLSPTFLHFGTLHLVFNCLWCWELGRRIEQVESSLNLMVLMLVTALTANFLQYGFGGAGVFGGLSGVVFGFVAYCGISQWLMPSSRLALNPTIYVIMAVFLLLGISGAFTLLGVGAIANAAHIGGLLSGAIWALIVRQFTLS